MQISFAKFEYSALDHVSTTQRLAAARAQFQAANDHFKTLFDKESRRILLEAWLEFEREVGDPASLALVVEKAPKAVKKRRQILDDNGVGVGWEEYFDYIFPEDGEDKSSLKLLQLAHQWKMKMMTAKEEEDSEEESEEEE